ncbi:ChuX/HutX family heme-like substrate-binding protein [Carnimonas bestiolae]|uniref:ChuX/HutX family heme-like substrate-binding protein n=1 Tax=Carnimonas bestiolae TaxID=3402172 RepID=UPI003EDC79CE
MTQAAIIREAYREAFSRVPDFNIQELARQLSISHGHIQAARIGDGVAGLALTPCDLVMRLPSLGALEITTTSSCSTLSSHSDQLKIASSDASTVSLRMLLPHWHWACLNQDEHPSIEVFDRYGRLLHRLASRPDSPVAEGWQRIARLQLEHQPAFTELVDIHREPVGAVAPELPYLADEWSALRSDSDITTLLNKHRLRRVEAYSALENRFTQRMTPQGFVATLERAAQAERPLRLGIANAGAIHHHTGVFGHVGRRQHHIEACGSRATLRIEREAIAHTWMVSYPSGDGMRTRLEAFGGNGRLIASLTDATPMRMPASTMRAMSVFG